MPSCSSSTALRASWAMPEKLPTPVRRCVVRCNRTSPPNGLRDWARARGRRLSRIPAAVWELPIDWSRYACDLDHAASVTVSTRAQAEIQSANDVAAKALHKAADALRSAGQGELWLLGVLQIQERKKPGSVPRIGNLVRHWMAETEVRLSLPELLDTMADTFAGKERQFYGIHFFSGPRRQGPQAAALEAACQVSALFERLLGRPCWDKVADVVHAYHPKAQERAPDEWARTLNARKKAP